MYYIYIYTENKALYRGERTSLDDAKSIVDKHANGTTIHGRVIRQSKEVYFK